jgi:predicted amidohydrolase YtcJ
MLPNRPLLLVAQNGHTAWANSVALEQGGILHGRTLGPGNEIVMDDGDFAQGELRDSEVYAPIYQLDVRSAQARLGIAGLEPESPPTEAQRAADRLMLKQGLDYCGSHGITSIQNMDGNRYTTAIGELDRAPVMAKNYQGDRVQSGPEGLRRRRLGFLTAVMLEDYADRPGWRGELLFEADRFARVAVDADCRSPCMQSVAERCVSCSTVMRLSSVPTGRGIAGAASNISRWCVRPMFRASRRSASSPPCSRRNRRAMPACRFSPTVSRIGEAKWL